MARGQPELAPAWRRRRGQLSEPGVPGNSVAPAGQAGDARRVAALEVWDDSPVPWWSQLRRRLRDDPGVWSLLERALGEHPATSGRLTGLRPLRPARPSFSA